MKLDESTRFPHPVLSPDTGDYKSGTFSLKLSVDEDPEAASLRLNYVVLLEETQLTELIEQGLAGVGLFVTCQDSYFSDLLKLGLGRGVFEFKPGELIGRVAARPMIWSTSPLDKFSLSNCNDEFGRGTCRLPMGAVLAMGDEVFINVGREKLAQMDTIFSMVESPDLGGGTFSIQLDAERITILAASDVYESVNRLRDLRVGRPLVLNSVYLPAVMEVLGALRDGEQGWDSRRWYKVFLAKCDYHGINIQDEGLWKNAQILLESPFKEVAKSQGLFGE